MNKKYKSVYLKLFNKMSDCIGVLQRQMIELQMVQLDCEEILTSDDSPISLEENGEE